MYLDQILRRDADIYANVVHELRSKKEIMGKEQELDNENAYAKLYLLAIVNTSSGTQPLS